MDPKLISTSKFLNLILRHNPEEIGLDLDAQGWADIDELIRLANLRGKSLSRSIVEAGPNVQPFPWLRASPPRQVLLNLFSLFIEPFLLPVRLPCG